MKQYINNRAWNPKIEKLGDKFNFGIKIFGETVPFVNTQPYTCIPLFAPSMFNNLYSDITEKLFTTYNNAVGYNIGLTGYTRDIWGVDKIDSGLNQGSLYPYSQGYKFAQVFGAGNLYSAPLTTSYYVWFDSVNMEYVNFLEYIRTESVFCSNINLQILQKGNSTNWLNAPIYFFQQDIDSSIKSIQTAPLDYIIPDTNVNTKYDGSKLYGNIDIPCDFIINKSSGIAFGYSNEVQLGNNDYYLLNFTLQKITK